MLGVHALSDIDPLFVVSYQYLQWADMINGAPVDGIFEPGIASALGEGSFPNVFFCSVEEQKYMLKALERNAKLLDKDYCASRAETGISCLVPMYPLSSPTIGLLSADTACAQCGKGKGMKCARCQRVYYCSKGEHIGAKTHQAAD